MFGGSDASSSMAPEVHSALTEIENKVSPAGYNLHRHEMSCSAACFPPRKTSDNVTLQDVAKVLDCVDQCSRPREEFTQRLHEMTFDTLEPCVKSKIAAGMEEEDSVRACMVQMATNVDAAEVRKEAKEVGARHGIEG